MSGAFSREAQFETGSVIGGITTGKDRLSPVADSMVASGLAKSAIAYTLAEAGQTEDEAALGDISVVHSLGLWAVTEMVERGVRAPRVVAAFCPVLAPMSGAQMRSRSFAKLGQTYADDDPLARDIFRHNQVQAIRHPLDTQRHAGDLWRVNSEKIFEVLRGHNTDLLVFAGSRDVLAPLDPGMELPDWVKVARLGGVTHDGILRGPNDMMSFVHYLLKQQPA